MLVMTDSLQAFIDEQVKATSEETKWFITRQVKALIETDPQGTTAETIINQWYSSETAPTETGDIATLKFAAHVVKALTIRRYIKETKTSSYWALVSMYEHGTHWQQQTASGEIAYRIKKVAGQDKLIHWLENMSTLTTKEQELSYLTQALTDFPGLEENN